MTAERLSNKVVRRTGAMSPSDAATFAHWCPGCRELHDFAVEVPFNNGARWQWDSNANRPSFRPSMNIRIGPTGSGRIIVCHYRLEDGKLDYMPDTTHSLSGETVPLPDIPRAEMARLGL